MNFLSLGLKPFLLKAVEKQGYTLPTQIQMKSIPLIVEGKDLLAQAQTGSGKTAAFALPILQKLDEGEASEALEVLVLTPTRELALQVTAAFKVYNQFSTQNFPILSLIGGEDIEVQIRELQKFPKIVVATPGRLLDLLSREALSLGDVKVLVLDEADRMLDQGFAEEFENLLKALPEERQNLLFSATLPEKMNRLSESFLHDPIKVLNEEEAPTVERIEQRVIEVNRMNRGPLLQYLIKTEKWDHVLVFVASCKAARNVAAKLRKHGIQAEGFHGELFQDERVQVLKDFKNRKTRVLVATDIAARGLDIRDLPYMVNFDLPRSPADYIHRIGRTGRAGKEGKAITFIGHEDQQHFALIEKRAQVKLPRESVKGFELSGEAPVIQKGLAPVKGKRPSKKDKARALALMTKPNSHN